ncbi:MAG: DUF1080 domain-containing protein [Bryobacteraceae bacterium]
MKKLPALLVFFTCLAYAGPKWVSLFNGRNLDGWEVVGDGVWDVLSDGTMVCQRHLGKADHQAWLYTREEFGDFEFEMDFWTRLDGNSGVSILDTSRGRYSHGVGHDGSKLPSAIGYEIQIAFGSTEGRFPTGSIYHYVGAKPGVRKLHDWNHLNIEHRNGMIRVKLNGQLVAEMSRHAERAKSGPIGFQLHDMNSVLMARNIRIKKYPAK